MIVQQLQGVFGNRTLDWLEGMKEGKGRKLHLNNNKTFFKRGEKIKYKTNGIKRVVHSEEVRNLARLMWK